MASRALIWAGIELFLLFAARGGACATWYVDAPRPSSGNGAVVARTVVDGRRSGAVVAFSGTEDERAALAGFTIRSGEAEERGGICGGTRYNHSHAATRNNVIRQNVARLRGGGMAYLDGTIERNKIVENQAD